MSRPDRRPQAAAERWKAADPKLMPAHEQIVYYELAELPAARRSGDQQWVAHVWSNLSIALAHEHRFEEALDYDDRARRIFTELGHEPGLVQTATNRGLIHAERGEPAAAWLWFAQALAGSVALADTRSADIAADNLIVLIHRFQLSDPEALGRLEQIEARALGDGRPFRAVAAARAQGEICDRLGRRADAVRALGRALQLACEADDPQWCELGELLSVAELRRSGCWGAYRARLIVALFVAGRLRYPAQVRNHRARLAQIDDAGLADCVTSAPVAST